MARAATMVLTIAAWAIGLSVMVCSPQAWTAVAAMVRLAATLCTAYGHAVYGVVAAVWFCVSGAIVALEAYRAAKAQWEN